MMIDHSEGGGKKGAGFWCEVCQRNLKDSLAYLDHVNGRLREFHSVSVEGVRCSILLILSFSFSPFSFMSLIIEL